MTNKHSSFKDKYSWCMDIISEILDVFEKSITITQGLMMIIDDINKSNPEIHYKYSAQYNKIKFAVSEIKSDFSEIKVKVSNFLGV